MFFFKKLILFLATLPVLACCQASQSTVSILPSSGGGALEIKVEIADTAAERSQGLMYREHLADGEGMLFIFPQETNASFWMKNTPLSLDLIFVKEGRVVDIIESATPFSEEMLTPDSSYTVVLEVPGGYAARSGIQVGDQLRY